MVGLGEVSLAKVRHRDSRGYDSSHGEPLAHPQTKQWLQIRLITEAPSLPANTQKALMIRGLLFFWALNPYAPPDASKSA